MTIGTKDDAMMLMLHQQPRKVLQAVQPRGIHEAIASLWPCLNVLHDEPAISYLSAAIAMTAQMLNTNQRMEGDAVRRTAVYVYEDYSHLNIEDVMLCLKMGVKGQLGEFYGRFDAQVVYDWFYEYNILRTQAKRISELRQL